MVRIAPLALYPILMAVLGLSPARAEDVAQAVPADAGCGALADPEWNTQEKFVWRNVCLGRPADFNDDDESARAEYGGNLEPKDAETWPASRTLTSRFIETILLKDKYRAALTRRGVRIIGARFVERVDLENAELRHELWLVKSRLHDGADLSGLRSTRLINFQDSMVSDILDDSSDSTHDLNMNGAQVGGDLFLDHGAYKAIRLENAVLQGELVLTASTVAGTLDFEGVSSASIYLDGAARFEAGIDLARAAVKGDVSLNNASFKHEIDLTGARISGDVNLGGGSFSGSIDLTGAQVGGELSLVSYVGGAPHPADWPNEEVSKLVLRNAKADAIPELCSAWPRQLELDGFTYRSGGSIPRENVCAAVDKKSPALTTWLAKLNSQSSQPYEQLALVLQSEGDSENATEVRYAGKEQERMHSTSWSWLGLTILKGFIGYGYHPERAFIPVFAFLAAGIMVMRISGEDLRNGLPKFGVAYTFDMLLPVIRLRDSHYTIDLRGWAQYYFYLHKIMGYVLASVLIAAVAGLTK